MADCDLPLLARDRCRFHYHQARNKGEFPKPERNKFCGVANCYKPFYGKGLCKMHYQRQTKYGRLDRLAEIPTEDRFWAKVNKTEDCWLWTGAVRGKGYGAFQVGSKSDGSARSDGAHRYSWILHNARDIPANMEICHHCDNPPCVNPEHLFLGTTTDNAKDMSSKNRWKAGWHTGEFNTQAKLTERKVELIKTEYATGYYRQVDIAKRFGVCQTTVGNIVRGKTWRNGNSKGIISAAGAYAD